MGCGLCRIQIYDASYETNHMIESQLTKSCIEEEKKLKILLLGSSDSGKSTIVKQMRILHNQTFNEAEMLHFRAVVYKNLIQSYHHIARGILQLEIPIPRLEKPLIMEFVSNHFSLLEMEQHEQIKILKQIQIYTCVENLLERKTDVYLPDNTTYFISGLDRILAHDYEPTTMDVIYARILTSGVYEIEFFFKSFTIRLIDVGGQKTERRKWLHCFSNVMAVLFVVALSSYDQVMVEDSTTNCMRDSLQLFAEMFKSQHLANSSFILFLNKMDLFAAKLAYSKFDKYFPKYKGNNDFDSAASYIQSCFLLNQRNLEKTRIFPHFTNATDTRNIELMFSHACDMIIQKRLHRSGMT